MARKPFNWFAFKMATHDGPPVLVAAHDSYDDIIRLAEQAAGEHKADIYLFALHASVESSTVYKWTSVTDLAAGKGQVA